MKRNGVFYVADFNGKITPFIMSFFGQKKNKNSHLESGIEWPTNFWIYFENTKLHRKRKKKYNSRKKNMLKAIIEKQIFDTHTENNLIIQGI